MLSVPQQDSEPDGGGRRELTQFFQNSKVNRNKKSLGLSFAHSKGVEILHKLAASSDILVENYLPGTLKKYGMDYDSIHALNSRYR